MGSHFVVHVKECSEFSSNGFKVAGLVAVFGLAGVTVDGIANPQDGLSFPLHGTDQSWKVLAKLFGSHANNNAKLSGNIVRVHSVNDADQFFGCALVGNLDSQWVANATGEFKVRTVQFTCAFSDPEHVGGTIVPATSGGIQPCEGLFVRQEQAFVGGEEVCLGKSSGGCVDSNGLHETEGFVNFGCKLAVSASFFSLFHKIQIPCMQSTNISVSTGRECSQNVQGLCTLMVGFHHVPWIVSSRFGSKFFIVDDISTVGWKRDSIHRFVWKGSRLGKLSSHASNFSNRHGTSKGQNERHLKNDPKTIPHVVHVEFGKGFGTVASHDDESLSLARARQLFAEAAHLSCKHERRATANARHGSV
mmetsp:Transcript_32927/g.50371  ORF Transcript_32927/g.50371 Transcript_32927/m.50371 type:complete len:362 (+) Transcript_32927:343-1428(+)